MVMADHMADHPTRSFLVVANCWIVGVVITFLLIRVAGSATARSLLALFTQ